MKNPLIWAALAPALATQLHAVVLVNETFSDDNRIGNSPPNSVAWNYGAHNGTAASAFTSLSVGAGSGQMVWDHTNASNVTSYSAVWGHFAPSGSPVSVAVGETLKLSFNVSFNGGTFITNSSSFRWALFNSGGNQLTTDFSGTSETGIASGTTFSGWRGYEGQTVVHNTTVSANSLLTRERTGTGNGLFTSANWTALTGSSATPSTTTAGSTLPVTLELTRTGSGMQVLASYGGVSTILVTDTSSPVTAFDTISFFTLDGTTNDITLSNINLELIPELTSAILGTLGFAGFAFRRTRNA